ncbi:MAG: hypothetical protein ACRCXC_04010 [Legionella sp.]
MKGAGEQYIGKIEDMGTAITTIFKIENGQSIVASQFLHQNIYMMSIIDIPVEKSYCFENGNTKVERNYSPIYATA